MTTITLCIECYMTVFSQISWNPIDIQLQWNLYSAMIWIDTAWDELEYIGFFGI